ncbi:hypothetical protein EDD11_009303 [Mortierella claussenii]|nr:hypothetical protein EDD11_009303 [Mortierella claussenii]
MTLLQYPDGSEIYKARNEIIQEMSIVSGIIHTSKQHICTLQSIIETWPRHVNNDLMYQSRLLWVQQAISVFKSAAATTTIYGQAMPKDIVEAQEIVQRSISRGAEEAILARKDMVNNVSLVLWELITLKEVNEERLLTLDRRRKELEAAAHW